MNSCTLIAKIVRSPELRYTQDNQTPISQMLVEFPGLRPEDPPATLKVVGWGNFASEIQEKYSEGDQVVIVGRLRMNTIERPEGFKEKRAELTASQIYPLSHDSKAISSSSNVSTTSADNVVDFDSFKPTTPATKGESLDTAVSSPTTAMEEMPLNTDSSSTEKDLDDIPF